MCIAEKAWFKCTYNRKLNFFRVYRHIYIYTLVILPSVRLYFPTVSIRFLLYKFSECNRSRCCTLCSYIYHGLVGNRNKFPSCQCELLVSCGNDEGQTALKWDRSSYPVAAPGCFSHHLPLKYSDNIGKQIRGLE
jgi:hypothetical protein